MSDNTAEFIALIREFPDRSIRWLLETPENVRGLLLIVDRDLANRIDYKRLERLNQTFILNNFKKLEADMLFVTHFLDDSDFSDKEVVIYILIEHQSSVDQMMPFRILSYITQIWDRQYREWEKDNVPIQNRRFRPILPIVFYTGNQSWNKPLEMKQLVDLPPVLGRFIPNHEMLFLNLRDMPSERLVSEDNPFGWILRIIQKEDASETEFGNELKLAIENLEKMLSGEPKNWIKLVSFILAFITHRRDRDQHSRLSNIVQSVVEDKVLREEVEKMERTMAQELIEEGMKAGLKQGLQQGKIEGKIEGRIEGLQEAISLGLEIKFGNDGLTLLENIIKIDSIEKLEDIMKALKVSTKVDEIKKLI